MAHINLILNAFQRAVLQDYNDGEHAALADREIVLDLERAIDDRLLVHILIELASAQDVDAAMRCVGSGLEDLTAAMHALEAIQDAIDAKSLGVARHG